MYKRNRKIERQKDKLKTEVPIAVPMGKQRVQHNTYFVREREKGHQREFQMWTAETKS